MPLQAGGAVPKYNRKSVASKPRDIIFPLYSVLLATSEVLGSILIPTVQERQIVTGKGSAEATKMMRGQEHLSSEDRLQELGLFSLQNRRSRRDLINMYKHFKIGYHEGGGTLFPVVPVKGQEAMIIK